MLSCLLFLFGCSCTLKANFRWILSKRYWWNLDRLIPLWYIYTSFILTQTSPWSLWGEINLLKLTFRGIHIFGSWSAIDHWSLYLLLWLRHGCIGEGSPSYGWLIHTQVTCIMSDFVVHSRCWLLESTDELSSWLGGRALRASEWAFWFSWTK